MLSNLRCDLAWPLPGVGTAQIGLGGMGWVGGVVVIGRAGGGGR